MAATYPWTQLGDAVPEGDRLFHATLVAATGSPRLRRFYGQLQQEQRLALALAERSSRELGRTADDHRQLLDALRGSRPGCSAAIASWPWCGWMRTATSTPRP
jgi:DNA-binding GntR family transcriptional regulator